MAIDFYMASMLNEQVKMLMQNPDGSQSADRLPQAYRQFFTASPTPDHLVRRAVGEDELDDDEEETVSHLEYAMDSIEKLFAYVYATLTSFWKREKAIPDDIEMNPVGDATPAGNVFTLEGTTPDTPGSQATPNGDIANAQSSYFPPLRS